MDKTKKIVAQMNTEHFTFIALGNTEEECLKAIGNKFRSNPHADRMSNERLEEYYGISFYQLADGECYCD